MTTPSNILSTLGRLPVPNIGNSLAYVTRTFGISAARQIRDMLALRYGPGKILPFEYFRYQLYDPAKSQSEKQEFRGDNAYQPMLLGLTSRQNQKSRHVFDDKAIALALLQATDIACTRNQASYAKSRRIGSWAQLDSSQQIVDFLSHDAQYPLYCKPVDGRQTYGGIALFGIDSDGTLILADDKAGPNADALAAEIVLKFPKGYLFQDHLVMDPALRPICPKGTGVGRIETLIDADGRPQALHATWRGAPPAGIMSDGTPVVRARLDVQTGRVISARRGGGIATQDAPNLDDGRPATDFVVAQLPAAVALVKRAHEILPDLALVGWDFALTETGPVVIEGNVTPSATLYQIVANRGIMNADLAPLFQAATARSRAMETSDALAEAAWQRGVMREIVAQEKGRLKN